MRLIDILNKIANGELKEGTKFVYRGNMYIWEDNMILNTTNTDAFDIADRSDLNMELELIEPQEPTECEHEWKNYTRHRIGEGTIRMFRRCDKCGLEEDIEPECFSEVGNTLEPTDNTTEKIEELKTYENSVMDIFYKLNEVIRYINK